MPSAAAAGVDIRPTMGSTSRMSRIVAARETPRNNVMVLPMTKEACREFRAPTAWPMRTVEPMASPTIITVSMCITWLPMETAVMLSVALNWPVINRSAIPYRVCRK